jgi:hypothetical protein
MPLFYMTLPSLFLYFQVLALQFSFLKILICSEVKILGTKQPAFSKIISLFRLFILTSNTLFLLSNQNVTLLSEVLIWGILM